MGPKYNSVDSYMGLIINLQLGGAQNGDGIIRSLYPLLCGVAWKGHDILDPTDKCEGEGSEIMPPILETSLYM